NEARVFARAAGGPALLGATQAHRCAPAGPSAVSVAPVSSHTPNASSHPAPHASRSSTARPPRQANNSWRALDTEAMTTSCHAHGLAINLTNVAIHTRRGVRIIRGLKTQPKGCQKN